MWGKDGGGLGEVGGGKAPGSYREFIHHARPELGGGRRDAPYQHHEPPDRVAHGVCGCVVAETYATAGYDDTAAGLAEAAADRLRPGGGAQIQN